MAINKANRFNSHDLQKFRIGDIVRLRDSGVEAAVIGSYRDIHDGNDIKKYSLMMENGKSSSWHHENNLDLVEILEKR